MRRLRAALVSSSRCTTFNAVTACDECSEPALKIKNTLNPKAVPSHVLSSARRVPYICDMTKQVEEAIRQILLLDWDPLGVGKKPHLNDEYNSYIPRVYAILTGSRSENDLATLLHEIKTKEIGLFDPPFWKRANLKIARKLLSIPLH